MAATVIWRELFELCQLACKLCFRVKFLITQFQSGKSLISRNENQDASSKKFFKTCEDDGPTPWSDLNHDILLLVMMQLGAFDFSAFSGVCKSWRSLAISNRRKFMLSIPPFYLSISIDANGKYYFKEGRFKIILPHSGGRRCVGFSSGYMVFFGNKTHDFWLVNIITRHELHFPDIPAIENDNSTKIKSILVFSPSISRWVFVMTDGSTNIWFSIAGQGTWNHVSTSHVVDLHAFKGKMYAINNVCQLCELILNPEPKLMLLETINFPNFPNQQFYSSRESLYVMRDLPDGSYEFHQLDFDKMKWILCKKPSKEWPSVHRKLEGSAPVKGKLFFGNFHHDRLNNNLVDE